MISSGMCNTLTKFFKLSEGLRPQTPEVSIATGQKYGRALNS